jgi:hypothetical protein
VYFELYSSKTLNRKDRLPAVRILYVHSTKFLICPHHHQLDKRHSEMTGYYRLNTIHGSVGSKNQQGFTSKQNPSDRWGSEDRCSDGESQTLTQQSSQRTQPTSSTQTNHFDNILSTQRHAEVVSYLKQFSRSIYEANSKQSSALSDLSMQLQQITKCVAGFSADARRLESSNREQINSLEVAVSKVQRELQDFSDLTRNRKYSPTNTEFVDHTNQTGSTNNDIDENEEGICLSDYLHGIQKRRLRLVDVDIDSSTGLGTINSYRNGHIEPIAGAVDEYDDLFMDDRPSREPAAHLRHQAARYTKVKDPRGPSNFIASAQSDRKHRRDLDTNGEDLVRRRPFASDSNGTSGLSQSKPVFHHKPSKDDQTPIRWGGKSENIGLKRTREECQLVDKWGTGSVNRKSLDDFTGTSHAGSMEKGRGATSSQGNDNVRSREGLWGRHNAH